MKAVTQNSVTSFQLAAKARSLLPQQEAVPLLVLIVALNVPMLAGIGSGPMIFYPAAACGGEWWRWFTHPFVHVSWYHFLLDGAAFIMLYTSLIDTRVWTRLGYVIAGAAGSLLFSWIAAPAIATNGLCGLSGIAHGLMAVSSLEMLAGLPPRSTARRVAIVSFILATAKAG